LGSSGLPVHRGVIPLEANVDLVTTGQVGNVVARAAYLGAAGVAVGYVIAVFGLHFAILHRRSPSAGEFTDGNGMAGTVADVNGIRRVGLTAGESTRDLGLAAGRCRQ